MSSTHLAFLVPLVILTVLIAGLAAFTAYRNPTKGSGAFALMLAAMAAGTFAYVGELLSVTLDAHISWMRVGYLFHPLIPAFWFYFCLRYAEIVQRRRWDVAAWFFVIPVIAIVLAWTNNSHGLFFGELSLEQGPFGSWLLVPKQGFYAVYAGYSGLLMAAGLLLVARQLAQRSRLQAGQALLILLGGGLPIVAASVFVFLRSSPLPGLNLTPYLIGLLSPLWVWALFRYRLFDVLPLAQGWVLRNLPDGMLVLNRNGLVLDMNPAAETLLGVSLQDVFGEPVQALLPAEYLPLPEREENARQVIGMGKPRRHIEIRVTPLLSARDNLVGRVMTLRDVTDRELASQAERRARVLAEALHDSAMAISSSLELDAVLDAILDQLGRVLPHDGASIIMLEGDELSFVRVRGHDQKDQHQDILKTRWRITEMPNYEQMRKSHEPIVIPDAANDARWRPVREGAAWIKSWASAPIVRGGRVIGFLNLDSTSPGYYDESVKQPLLSFADLAGVALANAQTYATDHRARVLAEALHDSALAISGSLDPDAVLDAILDHLGRVLPHDGSSIMLLEGEELSFARSRGHDRYHNFESIRTARWPITKMPTYVEMCETHHPIVLADTYADPRWNQIENGANWILSWASAPILHGDQVIGFLNLDSAQRNAYSESVLEPLRSFADLAGVALANARLYQAEQRAREEIEVLQRLSQHISEQVRTEQTLHAIAESCRTLLHTDSSVIYLADPRQDKLVVAIALGEFTPAVGQTLDRGEGLAGRVWEQGSAIVVEDYQNWDGRVSRPHSVHLRSAVAVPISWRDRPLGVVTVATTDLRHFTAQESRLLTLLASEAATALQNAQLVDQLERTVTEMVRRNDELDSFSYNVAHDLRAPLGTITGYIEFARMELASELSPDLTNILTQVSQATTRMNEIIEALLVLARLNSQDAVMSEVDLNTLMQQIAEEQAHLIKERAIQLHIEPLPTVRGYEPWLRLIFSNLLNNAIKYIGALNKDPHITIRGRQDGDYLRYEVEDNGVGIPEKVRGRVFEKFTRFSSQEAAGMGLGLSIVFRIVTRMKGEVLVEAAPEKGSIFAVRLPRSGTKST